jgi:hypothetical protein
MKTQFFAKTLFTVSLLSLAACSQGGFVNKANISTYVADNNQYVSLKTTLDKAQVVMPVAQIPIISRKDPSVIYGFVQVTPNMQAGTEFRIDVNLNSIVRFRPGEFSGTLPNGLPLPIAGFNPATAFTVPVSDGSRFYMDLDIANKKAYVGAALGLKEFRTGIAAGIFFPFNQATVGVNGLAGIFTGPQQYQSGFAVFADVSSALDSITGGLSIGSMASMSMKSSTTRASAYQFRALSRESSQVYQMLQRVDRSGRRLTVQ